MSRAFNNFCLSCDAALVHFVLLLEFIEVLLCGHSCVLVFVIPALCVHTVNHADGQQTKVPDGQAELYAAEEKNIRKFIKG